MCHPLGLSYSEDCITCHILLFQSAELPSRSDGVIFSVLPQTRHRSYLFDFQPLLSVLADYRSTMCPVNQLGVGLAAVECLAVVETEAVMVDVVLLAHKQTFWWVNDLLGSVRTLGTVAGGWIIEATCHLSDSKKTKLLSDSSSGINTINK